VSVVSTTLQESIMTSTPSSHQQQQSSPPPPVVYHLAGACAANAPALMPAEAIDPNLPDRVSDLPTFYYWKDAIVVGRYVHPAGTFSLDITRQKLDGYIDNFHKMQANGVGVPILMDHAPSAAATLGWIVDLRRQDDRLLELHQFLGEEARDIGLRNKVSLGIDPDFVDGQGNRYGEAIVHSAVTPLPVVPGQGEFERMMLSLAPIAEEQTPSPGTADRGSPGEGGGDEGDLREPAAIDISNHPHPNPLPEYRERGADGDAAQHLQLAMTALLDATAAKRDLAVARGGIDPAVAGELFSLLVQPRAGAPINTMLLSRGPDHPSAAPVALAVFDALSRNRPVQLGEITRPQVLSRVVPGLDGNSELSELQQRMIALASAKV
jgi:hypothetical protein